MILLISIIITILFWFLAVKTDRHYELVSTIAFILGIIGTVIVVSLACIACGTHIPILRDAEYNNYTQRYNSIMYALENSSESVRLLTTEISDYNSEVLNGRMMMDSKMFGILDYDFYYDLPLIDNNTSK